ncbi:MAG: rod shape-determining protein RodA [Candidatus Latescibacteria bacterium]|nr:rod shape-determining protein RodA [Candidatus Latescibacterota bacterium]
MTPINKLAKETDRLLVGMVFLAILIGIAAIYSSTSHSESEYLRKMYQRQILWGIFALLMLWMIIEIPQRLIHDFAYLIFGIDILALILVLFVGEEAMGARRWFKFGPFSLQPSEISKLGVVFALARYLSQKHLNCNRPKNLIIPLGMVGVPFLLILRQPDLGTAVVFVALLFPLMYWAGLEPINLFFLISPLLSGFCTFSPVVLLLYWAFVVVVLYLSRPGFAKTLTIAFVNFAVGGAVPMIWERLHDYQKQRIITFLNPGSDPYGAGYQIIQSKIAIGSGGLTGKGFLHGTQTKLAFLPERHTDFIFPVIGEEWGFLGALCVLTLFFLIIWRGLKIASSVKVPFSSLMAVGLTAILALHVFINIGMTVGLMPVTGLPLPFISYGGSSLVMNVILVGLLLNIGRRRS